MADVDPNILRNVAYAWLYLTVTEVLSPGAPKLLASDGFDQTLLDSIRQSVSIANQVALHTDTTSAFQKVATVLSQVHPLDAGWVDDEHPTKTELNSIFIAPAPAVAAVDAAD
jgi:hypothetical protein